MQLECGRSYILELAKLDKAWICSVYVTAPATTNFGVCDRLWVAGVKVDQPIVSARALPLCDKQHVPVLYSKGAASESHKGLCGRGDGGIGGGGRERERERERERGTGESERLLPHFVQSELAEPLRWKHRRWSRRMTFACLKI